MANQKQQDYEKYDQNHERDYMYGRLLAVLHLFERHGIRYPKDFVGKNWNKYHNYPESTYEFLLTKVIEEVPQFRVRDKKTYETLFNELEHIREIIDSHKKEYDEQMKKQKNHRIGSGSMFGYERELTLLKDMGIDIYVV